MIIHLPQIFPSYQHLEQLFSLYQQANSCVRLVGGCVRDAILNIPAGDIDLATPLLPVDGLSLLKKRGIAVKTYGLSHGTITAILGGKSYEITTLRTDDKTFGRHAEVSFRANWEEDANRRDFTLNALYADTNGTVYDYVGGTQDALTGTIRFVGSPSKRICEDYLRILRLFRFYVFYGKQPLESLILDACSDHKKGLKQLSGERIKKEIYHLLKHSEPYETLALMNSCDLLNHLNFGIYDHSKTYYLKELEFLSSIQLPPFYRLLCFFPDLPHYFKFFHPTREEQKIIELSYNLTPLDFQNQSTLKNLCYRYGCDFMHKLCSVVFARHQRAPSSCLDILLLISSLTFPVFPLKGEDLLSTQKEGIKIGIILKKCFEWWVLQFPFPSKEDCLYWIKKNSP